MKKRIKIVMIISIIIPIILGYLIYNGYIWFNNPGIKKYPIRGIDISNHQRNIDWGKVKKIILICFHKSF